MGIGLYSEEYAQEFENHPNEPEFPPSPHYKPSFPATSTKKIILDTHTNVWVKDESENPTGTCMDRMAWELVISYTRMKHPLPPMSIISCGPDAIAIQNMFNLYNLPKLKVLCDTKLAPQIIEKMKKLGCEVYIHDISGRTISTNELLHLTDNPLGFDINRNPAFRQETRFFDWLSYEIINEASDYCFIPFKNGFIYGNILNVLMDIGESNVVDPRLMIHKKLALMTHFMGADRNNPKSSAVDLFEPLYPQNRFDRTIQLMKHFRFLGSKSNIDIFDENYLQEAIQIMKTNNIDCDPSGATGLARFLQIKDSIPSDAKVLIVNTGSSRAHYEAK